MNNRRCNLLFVVSCLTCMLLALRGVRSTGTLSVQLIEYKSNDPPVGRRNDGSFCDASTTNPCEPFFIICFKPGGVTSCDQVITGKVYFGALLDLSSFPLPFFHYKVPAINTLDVEIDIWDTDSLDPLNLDSGELMGLIDHVVPVSIGTISTTMTTGTGYHEMTIEITGRCDEGFFPPDCTKQCIPADDSVNGHFTCDINGDPQCLTGFESATDSPPCNTDINECSSSPCLNGGSCTQGPPGTFTCACATGSTGDVCSVPQQIVDLTTIASGNPKRNDRPSVIRLLGEILFACPGVRVLPVATVDLQGFAQISCYEAVISSHSGGKSSKGKDSGGKSSKGKDSGGKSSKGKGRGSHSSEES